MKQIIKIVSILTFFLHQEIIFGEIPARVAAFKKAIQDPTKVANCAQCDFRGTQELIGVDAHGANLPGLTLQPCISNSVNQNIPMLCIPNQVANLTGINLANANLFSSCLDGAIFDGANLSNANLSNSSAQYASFKGANVTGIITTYSTFCNATMPDGALCTDSWTGQGVTIACSCTPQETAALASAMPAAQAKSASLATATSSSKSASGNASSAAPTK